MKRFSLILIGVISLISCNKNGLIELEVPVTPVIELDSETGIYLVKVGRELTIAPTVLYAHDDAIYSWLIDNKLVESGPRFTGSWDQAGEIYVTFRVENPQTGKSAEELLRVDVAELAGPVISLALPSQGLKVLGSTDYIFAPDIQNTDLEEFVCEWIREGEVVSTETTYTFNETEFGLYKITVNARNADGSDSREIEVEVVDVLPYEVAFETPSFFQTSTDRFTFAGRPVYLRPLLTCFDHPAFEWSVNGVPVTDETGQLFKFVPENAGEKYTVSVAVQDNPGTVSSAYLKLTRNITRAATLITAQVDVYCVDETEEERYRAASGASSPLWNKVYEYTPAPGQFIGEEKSGYSGYELTPEAAAAYAEKRLSAETYVSLGGFGGYIVVGFDHSIRRTDNLYDFAIQGNAFDGSSEPGVVWVMQDVNGNGLPDDEWYELRGSETGQSGTLQDYEVTYYRPAGKQMDVQWTDSEGKSGRIDYLISYHRQDYYYPIWIREDSYTLRGTRLPSRNLQDPATGYWYNATYDWGYADNFGEDCLGGDAWDGSGQTNGFKISNAMHRDGTPADLQYIDFIKVQTGVNAKSGWLGEVSTEVFSFTDLSLTN